ncbi:MAG: helix-turn-helix domain-containing protein [Clostridiales bacterium]|nr:helix-turn-helix domain-containing protein [Clostridiales bacterium]
MKYRKVDIMPDMQETLSIMGEQIKMARLRRKISVNLAAERAGVSRATIWRVEKGDAGVAIGIYANVLHALNGLDTDLLLIAKDDELGRKLQDIEMATKKINRR